MAGLPPLPDGFALIEDKKDDAVPPLPEGFVRIDQPARSSGWDGAIRAVGRGVLGVGSYGDEINALANATLAPYVDPMLPDTYEKLPQENWGDRYDAALQIQRRKDAEYDEDRPWTSTGLKVLGGIGSAIALGQRMPKTADYVLGGKGTNLVSRVLWTGGSAGGTGAVQGFGAGEDGIENRLWQGLEEAGYGAGAGVAAMPIIAAGKSLFGLGSRYLRGEADDALSGLSKPAQRFVEKSYADPSKASAYREALDTLGPDAMLADVGPEWLGVARGAATRPETRAMVIEPLLGRHKAANDRLRQDMVDYLGERVIPSRIEQGIEQNLDEVGKLYKPLMKDASPVDTSGFAKGLDGSLDKLRGPEREAVQRVRGWLNEPGKKDASGKAILTSDPETLHGLRMTIDAAMRDEKNDLVVRQMTIARKQLDDLLADAVPGLKDVDAQFSELKRQEKAITKGRAVLNNEATAIRPEELQEILAEGALPQGNQIGASAVPTRIRQAARGEIDRAVGTKANDTTALRNIVRGEGDWNRDKLGMLFGEDNAEKALNAIDREARFGATANRVEHGSDTAMGAGFGKFLDETATAGTIPADTTLTGLGLRAGRSILSSVMQKNAEANAGRFAEDIGRLSVAQGAERDAIVEALLKRGERIQKSSDPETQKLINALAQATARSAYPSLPWIRN